MSLEGIIFSGLSLQLIDYDCEVMMEFGGFSQEALDFLNEIKENNNKEWFEANKYRYEALILKPSRNFVQEMGEHLQALVPTINAHPKVNGSLFRIYRDIRFSKDKTPIKTKIGIIFWQGSSKRMQSSSFYMHFDKDKLFIAVGIRGFNSQTLQKYRDFIKEEKNAKSLCVIIEQLEKKGYTFPKPKYKRLPNTFDKSYPFGKLALYDSMFAYLEVKHPEQFFTVDLCDWAYEHYQNLFSLQQWVYEMTLH